MKEIIVDSALENQRLDKLLGRYLDAAPKSFIYKMLRKKNIKLNKGKATGSEMLKSGDVINIFLADDTIAQFKKVSDAQVKPSTSANSKDIALNIIYEDENILMVNKPVGLLSQKAVKEDISINEYIVDYYASKENANELFVPSVCNRLDRNTSGIILAGMSLKGSQGLSHMLKERTLDKYYYALVLGVLTNEEHLDGYLFKDEMTNKVIYSHEYKKDYEAIKTDYEPIKNNGEYTLLRVKLITGKPHQIRAHLASIKHPIVGDFKYGNKKINEYFKDKYKLKNQLLHAREIHFPRESKDLYGLDYLANKTYEANIPQQFKNILNSLNL